MRFDDDTFAGLPCPHCGDLNCEYAELESHRCIDCEHFACICDDEDDDDDTNDDDADGTELCPVCDYYFCECEVEPPDADGETFRGSEAAAFDREELMRIVEELK